MACERRVVQAGYLIKSPPQEKLMAQWHRRYFILLSTKVMEYYSSHECKPQDYLKSINLSQCEDMIAPLPTPSRPYVIKLSIKTGPKLREYLLDCSNEENMSSWVMSLAQTCGFCPVDPEVDEHDHELYSSADFTNQTTNRSPQDNAILKDNNSIGGSATEQDWNNNCPDQFYDDLGINVRTIYAMNKNPPPIWRPKAPILPIKVERFAETDGAAMGTQLSKVPMVPPNKMERSEEPDNDTLGTQFLSRPPIVPSGSFSPSVQGLGMQMPDIFSLNNDPKFRKKLQQKRQEIYDERGAVFRDRSVSVDGVQDLVPQESYDAVDSDVLSGLDLQCNSDDNPEDYLDFKSDTISASAPQTLKTMSMMRNVTTQNYKSRLQKAIPVPQREVGMFSSSLVQRDVAQPPLPSRELIHPLTVSSSRSLSISPHVGPIMSSIHQPPQSLPLPNPLYPLSYEDIPPPIPVRISSNRSQSSSSNTSAPSSAPITPVQEVWGKHRAMSSAQHSSSPTDSQIPKRQPLPPNHHNIHQTESSSFTDTLAHIFSSKHPSSEKSTSPGFTGREAPPELGTGDYDDIEVGEFTGRQVETGDYDDIEVGEFTGRQVERSSMDASCSYSDPTVNILRSSSNTCVQGEEFYDDVVFKPVQQQTCKQQLSDSPPHKQQLPGSSSHERQLPDSPPREQQLLDSPLCEQQLPDSPPRERRWPDSPPRKQQLPDSPPRERRWPDSPPREKQLPDSPPRERRWPRSPPREQQLLDSPPHEQQWPDSPSHEQRLPDTPPPDKQDIQPNTSERKSVVLSLESHFQASLSRANSCPPVPPVKPKIPSDKRPLSSVHHHPPPLRPKPSKPAVTEKPIAEQQTNLVKKPSLMKKPPVAKRTVLIDQVSTQVVTTVKKADPPPTQPKPSSKTPSIPPPIRSASSSPNRQQNPTMPPPVKHKPKPPGKSLQVPLCS